MELFSKPGEQRRDVDPGLAEDVERAEPDSRRGHVHRHEHVPVVATQLLVLGHDADLLRLLAL